MFSPLPMNVWILVPQGWPVLRDVSSVTMKFVFHHIRPFSDWRLASMSGPFMNEVGVIEKHQVSMIAGIRGEFFVCHTLSDSGAPKASRLLSAAEYARHPQAKEWFLSWRNLYRGDWEVFNGPNPIDIG